MRNNWYSLKRRFRHGGRNDIITKTYSTQMSLGNFPISRKSSLPLVAEFMLTRRAKGLPARSMTISSSLSATWFKSVPKFWRISIAETTFDMICPSVTRFLYRDLL